SFARYGWCASIRGVEGGGTVEGLPGYTFTTDSGEFALKCPTEIAITDRLEMELSKFGFIPFCHQRYSDTAVFFSVNTVQKSRLYDSPEANENARLTVQLPIIFAASRFAHYLMTLTRDKIGSFMSATQMEAFLNSWIKQYVLDDDHGSNELKAKFPLRQA